MLHITEGSEVFRNNAAQYMWDLTVRGYFTEMEALERAGENLNGTSFRVGTGTFLSLPKQKILAVEKDN